MNWKFKMLKEIRKEEGRSLRISRCICRKKLRRRKKGQFLSHWWKMEKIALKSRKLKKLKSLLLRRNRW